MDDGESIVGGFGGVVGGTCAGISSGMRCGDCDGGGSVFVDLALPVLPKPPYFEGFCQVILELERLE